MITPLFTDVISLDRTLPAARRHLQLLAPLGIMFDLHAPLDYAVKSGPGQIDEVDRLIGSRGGESTVGLAPGSAWPTKQWPLSSYVALARSLAGAGKTVVIVGGHGDVLLASRSKQQLESMRRSTDAVLCLSVGPRNSFEGAKCLCRTIQPRRTFLGPWGLHALHFWVRRCGPLVSHTMCLRMSRLKLLIFRAGPCTSHGGARCPLGTHVCMTAITHEHVLQSVLSFG